MNTFFQLPPEQEAIRAKCFHPSGSFVEFPKEEIEQSIPDRFEKMVYKYGRRLAVKAKNRALTYDELNRLANHVAREIVSRSGPDNEPVALLFQPGISGIAAILGALKAGKIYVALDPSHPRSRNGYILEDIRASLIVTNDLNAPIATDLARSGCAVLDIDRIDPGLTVENIALSLPADTLASIMYTSGSTGQPKGVVQNHRNVLHAARSYINGLHIAVEDRLTLVHSCSFNGSVYNLFGALLNGAALFPFDLKVEGANRLGSLLIRDEISIYHSSPTVFSHAVEALTGGERFSNLRVIHLSGAPVSNAEVRLYKQYFPSECIFVHRMGVTETGTIGWYFIDKAAPAATARVPIGYPADHKEILLLDELGESNGDDRTGEIAVRSSYLSLGYWQKPELTQARFLPDPKGGNRRIYLTGDLGRVAEDGRLYHLGRKDFQVKIHGYMVEVSEVERVLREHSSIDAAVVVGRKAPLGDKNLVAYFVSTRRPPITVTELREFLKDRLADYMIPSAFVMLPTLPLTPNGRINHAALPDSGSLRPALDVPFTPPETPIEKTLAGLCAEILSLDCVGVHDNFFELGGHSLSVTRLISRIRRSWGIELAPRSVFEVPTVAGIAALIGTLQSMHSATGLSTNNLGDDEELGKT